MQPIVSPATTPSARKQRTFKRREIPIVRGLPIVGSTLAFQRDPIPFTRGLHAAYGDVVRTRIVTEDWCFVLDPSVIDAINTSQWELFHKPRIAKRLWKPFMGDGLVPSDGPLWKRHHTMVKPGFRRERLEGYVPIMRDRTLHMIRAWKEGEPRNAYREMVQLTLGIMCRSLFSAQVDRDGDVVARAIRDVNEMLIKHIQLPLPVPEWWPSPGNRRKIRAIRTVERIIHELIAERRAEGVDHGDILSHLVFAEYPDGTRMTNKEIRDEAVTLFFAGHDSTGAQLAWCWYLIASHPEVTQKLVDEIDTVLNGREITMADFPKLPYLDMVVKETMRHHPAVWAYMREPIEDVEINGYVMQKSTPIFISPWLLGRDPRFHPDPLRFTPERWTPEYERAMPKGSFVPFAAGPRVCLGKAFATIEMKIVIGTLLQRIHPHVQADFVPDYAHELVMNPGKTGIPFRVCPRE